MEMKNVTIFTALLIVEENNHSHFFPLHQHENLEGYRQYLYGVVGFFVIEDHVLNTGNGLVTRPYLDEVWDMASGKVG